MRRADVRSLAGRESYPSVSILMPTHRAHPENQQDAIRLKNLVKEARQQLSEEVGKRPSWPLMDRLETLSEEIDWRFNQDGLVLYASQDFAAWYRLPFSVEARVAIDRTFDTRDILYALHRMPRYRVLALAERPTRLFEGSGELLEEVRGDGFPISRKGAPGATRRPDAPQMRKSNIRPAHLDQFFTEVDRALTAIAETDDLALVLIGTRHSMTRFEQVSKNVGDIAIRIEGSYDEAGPAQIAELAWPRLEEWLAAQRQSAVQEVGAAAGAERLASGIEDAWKAALAGRGAKLVAEEGYRRPAVLQREGWELEIITDEKTANGPAHLDDAVDELTEIVLEKGGKVVFVDEGALTDYGRVALILRY
jgi:hypothetical protein